MRKEAVEIEQKSIHDKGFNITEYGSIKVGNKKLDNAVLNLNSLAKREKYNYGYKETILRALINKDYNTIREVSEYFYNTSGIYQKACDFAANMYRYDWYVVPEVYDETVDQDKVTKSFFQVLKYLDNSFIKKNCGDMAKKIIKYGAFYGYIVETPEGATIQELPIGYCRSRYNVGNMPAIEFKMSFFDEKFSDPAYRMRILKLFPDEFSKGYQLYKEGKLPKDNFGDNYGCWYLLDPAATVKFSLNEGDLPLFISAIPTIIDLDSAQDLDRRKQMQKLLKILIQKLPLDKNGDLIFDIEEARDIHNNMVEMLGETIGVDVVTTFADVMDIDVSDDNTSSNNDDLQRVERTVYNELGIPSNMFNPDGSIAMEKAILNAEGNLRSLVLQFGAFYDRVAQSKSLKIKPKKYRFRLYMMETTQYNYKEIAKIYKEQTQLGFPKMYPQIALGHSQSSILYTIYFENNVLNLSEVMIPPMMSSTMNAEGLQALGKKKVTQTDEKKAGRPALSEGEKSDKTLANIESMS